MILEGRDQGCELTCRNGSYSSARRIVPHEKISYPLHNVEGGGGK